MLIAKTLKAMNSDTKIPMTNPGMGAELGSVAEITSVRKMTIHGTAPARHPKM